MCYVKILVQWRHHFIHLVNFEENIPLGRTKYEILMNLFKLVKI